MHDSIMSKLDILIQNQVAGVAKVSRVRGPLDPKLLHPGPPLMFGTRRTERSFTLEPLASKRRVPKT